MGVILSACSSLSWIAGVTQQKELELIDNLESRPFKPGSLCFLPYLSLCDISTFSQRLGDLLDIQQYFHDDSAVLHTK